MSHDETDSALFAQRRDALLKKLPAKAASPASWLLAPSHGWMRIPAGVLLMLGGIFSFLPILGAWMLPLGLVLLAEDIPPFRRLCARGLGWAARKYPHWFSGN